MVMRMDDSNKNAISRMLFLSPLIFIGHFLEEAPSFVEWFNAHVSRGITSGAFWQVNLSGLVLTIIVIGMEWLAPSFLSLNLVIAWFSFLMLANALLHIVGSFVDGGYVPGLVTAVLFYLPYYFWLMTKILKSGRANVSLLLLAAALGATPMIIHGYRILFLGDRLF
jgi:hypothetical protein